VSSPPPHRTPNPAQDQAPGRARSGPAPSAPLSPPDVPGLLRALLTADPVRPRVTWYGPEGERIELSAKVLDNWVAKSANLLVDELDTGPGSAVVVDLPGHWRTLAWLLAIWATGATAVLATAADPPAVPSLPTGRHPDVVLTLRPHVWVDTIASGTVTSGAAAPGGAAPGTAGSGAAAGAGTAVLAVALPALATRFPGDLTAGVVDTAAEVRGHGDVFVPVARPVPADPALVAADGAVTTHGDLLSAGARAVGTPGWGEGVRLLTGSGPDQALTWWLPALLRGGSLVLHHDLAGLDAGTRDRLVAQEGVRMIV
jgi:uncharacterized protein (TIGR03089 family)